MLILTRKVTETIIITAPDGTEITVSLLGVKGGQARIGVAAPKTYAVHREEVYDRIKAEQQGADRR